MNSAMVVLIDRTETLKDADRAWSYMGHWTPATTPSQIIRQVNRALGILEGINPGCRNDPIWSTPHLRTDMPPLGTDGRCIQCWQPQCRCTPKRGKHQKGCPAA